MLEFPLWKKVWIWLLALGLASAALPSIASISGLQWPDFLPNQQVNLGLDLAGGSQILLEANPEQVKRQRLDAMEEAVQGALRRAEPRIEYGDMSSRNGQLTFLLQDPAQVDAARAVIEPLTNGVGITREWNFQVVDDSRIILTPNEAALDQALADAMDSATEVVRKRIDALGTREPTIVKEAETRISVQVPGLDDPETLKSLLGKTADLEFKLVDTNALQSDIQQGIAPPGSEIVPYAPGTDFEGTSIAVKRLGGIRGNSLTAARQGFNPQNPNEAVVDITFDQQGGARFARLTEQNVGRPFAMILDGQVLSAPNINEPIRGGQAQISGNFTVETAQELAIALQSGALPVELTVIQQGSVGAELGQDSIVKGLIAMGVGALAVLILMAVTYGRFGLYANAALVLNVLMLLGVMSIANTTLTLPGIAGFVLTIGAAVDANVLINERIREERKRGRNVFAAVEHGYKEASRAIFDANITNVIAAVMLFAFGSGPVRGFAVVLMIGIVTSVFTAVTLTRMWVAGWLRRARPQDLNV